jgi:hypothetical protein
MSAESPTNKHKESTMTNVKTTVEDSVAAEKTTGASTHLDVELQPLIDEAKDLWKKVKPNILRLGEIFSRIRLTTESRKKKSSTNMTYSEAVRATGCPYSSAEFYRRMFEVVKHEGINQDVFLALFDSGINLSSDRYRSAMTLAEIKTLDATDARAVKKMADELKDGFPPVRSSASINQLRKDANDLTATLNKSTDAVVRRAIEAELEDVGKALTEEQRRLIATLHEIAEIVSGTTDWKNDPKFSWVQEAEAVIVAKLAASAHRNNH